MEYLITYGVAIFIILIVLVVLIPQLQSMTRSPGSCIFDNPGFSCSNPAPALSVDTLGKVSSSVRLHNQNRDDITLVATLCTTAPPSQVSISMAQPVAAGADRIAAGSFADLKSIPCKKVESGSASDLQLTKGSDFRGSLIVWYHFGQEIAGAPPRTATASMSGSVLEQVS